MTPTTKSQRQRILDILIAAHGQEVPSVALSRISLQYGARVKELREMGFRIPNRTVRREGKVYGFFRLESGTGREPASPMQTTFVRPETGSFPEFGILAPMRYPD
jgi:hypothetical protein